MTYCVFCDRSPLEPRVFYDRESWYAFLTAPPYARGHTILALKNASASCPTALTSEHLRGLDAALGSVISILDQHYHPKDVLVASLRGRDPHIHFHLMPLWEAEERAWRQKSFREKGYLFEYLGHVERKGELKAQRERVEQGWSEEQQRTEIVHQLQPDIDALRATASYGSA